MERGNHEALLKLTNAELDEVGNTEMLPWMAMFGAIGNQPGELLTYQPTWHHGHAVMRFIPNKREEAGLPLESKTPTEFKFQGVGASYEFYKHPDPASYKLNKLCMISGTNSLCAASSMRTPLAWRLTTA